MVVVLWQLRGRVEGQDWRAARVLAVNASGRSDLCILVLFFDYGFLFLGCGGWEGGLYIVLQMHSTG